MMERSKIGRKGWSKESIWICTTELQEQICKCVYCVKEIKVLSLWIHIRKSSN